MKKFTIPLITVAVVTSVIFVGCAKPAPAPAPAPAPSLRTVADEPALQELVAKGSIDPNLLINPYEGLAIKPDGTPFKFANSECFLGCEWMVVDEALMRSLITRAGGEYTHFDPDFVLEDQIAFYEDQITVHKPDAIIIQPVQEEGMVPVCDMAGAAGIPVYNWDLVVPTDSVYSCVWHDFDSPGIGSDVPGQYFVDKAEELGEPLNIYECWCVRSMQTSIDRHVGFHSAVDQCPLITVMESGDTMAADEITAEFVMDAFTAHSELNALYHQCGGSTGAVEGLRAIGRLVPAGEPGHVWVCTNDTDSAVVEALDEGNLDAIATHQPWDLVDTIVKIMFNNVILGQPIPRYVRIPMTLLTPENSYTLKVLGGPAAYPHMPMGEWDKFPVLDTWNYTVLDGEDNEIRIPTPTVAISGEGYLSRAEILGY